MELPTVVDRLVGEPPHPLHQVTVVIPLTKLVPVAEIVKSGLPALTWVGVKLPIVGVA